jgi:hypothetical protein
MATKKTLTPRQPGSVETTVVGMEPLEGRQLLSGGGHHGGIRGGNTIAFSQAPTAVQSGLDTLAGTTLAATTTVNLANRAGLETYSVTVSGTGTRARYTVDQNGVAVSDPTHNTTTYAGLQTTDAAAANELATIATAENLTAPAGTDTVGINVSSGGLTTYSIRLTSAATTSSGRRHGPRGSVVTVDAAGNPSGDEVVPFSTLPTAIQDGLNNAAPAGATALTDTSNVIVRVEDGVELYSAVFNGTGTRTTVTVDNTGTLTSLPSRKRITFADVPAAAQTELQSLATAKGAGTIADTQTAYEYDEANGNVVYSVNVQATGTRNNGNTFTFMVTVSSDANGNPTVPPDDGGGFGGGFFGGGGRGLFGNSRRRHH